MMNMQHTPTFINDIRAAYLECALWADWPENYSPRSVWDCVKVSVDATTVDIKYFVSKAVDLRIDLEQYPAEQIGHDLWLTRNGHGAGFWDRPQVYGKLNAEKLATLARAMGSRYPYHISAKSWGISI